MKATKAFYDRAEFPDGSIVEMRIWNLPTPLLGSEHRLKYSLFYGFPGIRIVAYDNERGKGDHKHLREKEEPYKFTSVELLIADFLADVGRERGKP
jgi:hypothetical protein